MARKGARVVLEPGEATQRPRKAEDRDRGSGEDRGRWEPEEWVRDPTPARAQRGRPAAARGRAGAAGGGGARAAGTRGSTRGSPSRRSAADEAKPEGRAAGGPTAAARDERRLAEAAKAYEADRYADVRRLLRPLLERGDVSPAIRELHGLTLYRMGKWRQAIAELQSFAAATGSMDQHPVLADCHRALGQWSAVEELWEDIRTASPSAEVVTEGRIVAAGALADQGMISAALQLLERAPSKAKRPALHHLRLWYAQADLYERAGDIPRARELFRAIQRHDPDFVDTGERLAALD